MTTLNKTKPTPIPCICGRGDHRENKERQNDYLPEPGKVPGESADYMAQRRGVSDRGVEWSGAGGEV